MFHIERHGITYKMRNGTQSYSITMNKTPTENVNLDRFVREAI